MADSPSRGIPEGWGRRIVPVGESLPPPPPASGFSVLCPAGTLPDAVFSSASLPSLPLLADPGGVCHTAPRRGRRVPVCGCWRTPNSPLPPHCCVCVLCYLLCSLLLRLAAPVCIVTTPSPALRRRRTGSSSGTSRTGRNSHPRSARRVPLPPVPPLPLCPVRRSPPRSLSHPLPAVRPPLAWLWRPIAAPLFAFYRHFFASSRTPPLPPPPPTSCQWLPVVHDDDQ